MLKKIVEEEDMDLMRKGMTDAYGIMELQNKILEVMSWIDNTCSNHNIDYCLMGGSAIGAKRHGGFIPWDDDLDIFMTSENYSKFRKLFKNNKREGYYLQEWGKRNEMVTMAKVRMDGTTYIEEILEPLDMHHGIYVDIMILHNCPNNKVAQFLQYLAGRYIVAKGLADRGYNRRKDLIAILLKMLQLLPKGFAIRQALQNVYRYDNKDTKYYCNFLGKSNFEKSIYEKEWIDKPLYAPFETIELKIPAQTEKYLRKRFGDYMILPTAERIAWEQHAKDYSIDIDFRIKLSRKDDGFYDESKLI